MITDGDVIARAEVAEEGGPCWIAETRRRLGTWLIREQIKGDLDGLPRDQDPSNERIYPVEPLRGGWFPFFPGENRMLLSMEPEQRAALGMSDEIYQTINVELRLDFDERQRTRR